MKKRFSWVGAVTDQEIWAPATGYRFVVTDYRFSCSSACTVIIHDGADADNWMVKGDYAQYGGESHGCSKPYESDAVNQPLYLTTDAAGGYGTVWGYEVKSP